MQRYIATTAVTQSAETTWEAGRPTEDGKTFKLGTTGAYEQLEVTGHKATATIERDRETSLDLEANTLNFSYHYNSLPHGGYEAVATFDLIMPEVFSQVVGLDYIHAAGVIVVDGLPSFKTLTADVSRCLANGWVSYQNQRFVGGQLACFIEIGGKALSQCFNVAYRVTFDVAQADSGRVTFNNLLSLTGVSQGTAPNVGLDKPTPSDDSEDDSEWVKDIGA